MQPGLTIFTCRNVPTTSQDKDIHVFEKNHLLLFDLMQVVAFHLRRPQVRPRPIGGEWGGQWEVSFGGRCIHLKSTWLLLLLLLLLLHRVAAAVCLQEPAGSSRDQVGGNVWSSEEAFPISRFTRPPSSHPQELGLQASGLVKLTSVYVVSFINPFAFGLAFSSQAGP